MSQAVRQTRSYLMSLFRRHGFNPRHDLGQNFLIDLNIIEFIVAQAELTRNDVVLEVGAGTGGMSTFMATQAAEVVSVELDGNMYKLATETTREFGNITLLNQDALKNKNNMAPNIMALLKDKLAISEKRRLKLVSNLPYNVGTPIISNLIASDLTFSRMVVTIQLELGLKMVARPQDSTYGALSVWLQSLARVAILKKLPPSVFWPRPKVNSAVVLIVPDPHKRSQLENVAFYNDFVRRLFHQRRKFMRSVLVGMYSKELTKPQIDAVLAKLGHSQQIRADELRPKQIVLLGNVIYRAIQSGGQVEVSQAELESAKSTTEDEPHLPPDLDEAISASTDDDLDGSTHDDM